MRLSLGDEMQRCWSVVMILIAALGWCCSSLPASAMDCTKASTETEKTICASDSLKAGDKRLGEIYGKALKGLSGDRRQLLIDSQRNWLTTRDSDCADQAEDCLADLMTSRIDEIAVCFAGSEPPSGKAVAACPYFLHRGCPALEASGSPGFSAYPVVLGRLVSVVRSASEDFSCDEEEKDRNMRTDKATIVTERPGLVCFRLASESDFAGAAHPSSAERMECDDLATNEPIDFQTVFPTLTEGSDALDGLLAAVNGHLTLDCCDDAATSEGTFDDIGLTGQAPSGWAVADNGNLIVDFEYNAYGRTFLATATVARAGFIDLADPAYKAIFVPARR